MSLPSFVITAVFPLRRGFDRAYAVACADSAASLAGTLANTTFTQLRGNAMAYSLSLHRRLLVAAAMAISLVSWVPAQAQESRWAAADEPTARSLIESERQWAEAGCTHNGIEKTILAEDFHGTAPDGSHYSKKEAVAHALSGTSEEACAMYEVRVHFFGDAMAILYGSEGAVHIEADGRRHTVKLTWTDTWLKRHGNWQIVAAQDMPSEVK